MSHTAGLTVHGFPGYDVDVPLPALVQIFNGEKPANTAAIRVDIAPGTLERCSGGGITKFGHNGADEGFQALLTMNANTGKGLAIMANSDLGIAAAEFVLQSVVWNYNPGPQTFSTLLLLAKRKGVPAALNRRAQKIRREKLRH
jgi:hypothetical protein